MSNRKKIQYWISKITQEDDQRAFRFLFDYYYPKLINYSRYLLESKSAADEVISNVFIGIWNNRTSINKIEKFDSYVFRSVKNKCLSYLRDMHRLQFEELNIEDSKLIKSVRSPESALINEELREEILKALDNLPPRCRLVFELIKQDGFKYKEVAELLDVSVNTVENQMGTAMSKLRAKLKHFSFSTGFRESISK
ncbi:MAG: RNA polymerase sigma-70 factor [Cyclobacteriaceae bacterium]|nr:RNA polymerase sigma-70 factor [Cyclobacteriaceae bacterium]MCK5278111.1 RNA polymerase sigma-70 factor [Cyclobacteriaceae bacterium]